MKSFTITIYKITKIWKIIDGVEIFKGLWCNEEDAILAY